MAKTNIEWTHQPDGSPGFTWNPLAGCTVLTPGCTNCYAMKLAARLGRMGQPLYAGLTKQTKGGAVWTGEMRRASDAVLMAPLKRKKPTTYFVNSMSDLFHENVPDEWIDSIFAVMALSPQHTFQVLTKRAKRMRDYMTERWQPAKAQTLDIGGGDRIDMPAETVGEDRRDQIVGAIDDIFDVEPQLKARFVDTDNDALWTPDGRARCMQFEWPLPNVWLGVSTERQQEADERIPLLLQTPAAVRFISAEPLLRPIDLRAVPNDFPGEVETWPRLDWVIVGGESGHGYRPMAAEWAYSLRDQCIAAGVPVFIKQMAGKKPIPADLQIRQFPN